MQMMLITFAHNSKTSITCPANVQVLAVARNRRMPSPALIPAMPLQYKNLLIAREKEPQY